MGGEIEGEAVARGIVDPEGADDSAAADAVGAVSVETAEDDAVGADSGGAVEAADEFAAGEGVGLDDGRGALSNSLRRASSARSSIASASADSGVVRARVERIGRGVGAGAEAIVVLSTVMREPRLCSGLIYSTLN